MRRAFHPATAARAGAAQWSQPERGAVLVDELDDAPGEVAARCTPRRLGGAVPDDGRRGRQERKRAEQECGPEGGERDEDPSAAAGG